MTDPLTAPPRSTTFRTIYWFAFLALHVFAAAVWFRLAPKGFPWLHPRFGLNVVAPTVVGAITAAGMLGAIVRRGAPTAAAVAMVATLWGTALLASCAWFPHSAPRFAPPGAVVALAVAAAWYFLDPTRGRHPRAHRLGAAVGIAVGLFVPWALKAPHSSTRPLNLPLEEFAGLQPIDHSVDLMSRSKFAHLEPATGGVTILSEPVTIEIHPLLTFESRSPDGFWTVLAPPNTRRTLERRLVDQRLIAGGALCRYDGTGAQQLRLRTSLNPARCEIEAFTRLDAPIDSHLNAYCEVRIRGHRDLGLHFSPCHDVRLEPQPADYPAGRPARFGYLDASGQFTVVEATSGEKGPFRRLAGGRLNAGDPLAIEVRDAGRVVATLTFRDWSRQASTDLSPTAGWGVPQNAVEFRRLGTARNEPVVLWLTLASTSVGRGFDSVGHAAGTYRNRLEVEVAAGLADSIAPEVRRPNPNR